MGEITSANEGVLSWSAAAAILNLKWNPAQQFLSR